MDLTNRRAICPYCATIVPSSTSLAFFQFRGENSWDATELCLCGYTSGAHENKKKDPKSVVKHVCDEFRAQGAREFDSYYCGCRGWD